MYSSKQHIIGEDGLGSLGVEEGIVLEFFLNVSLNSANSVTKVFVITVKGLEPATSCVRDQDATTVQARHVRGRIFKLTPIHTSVIYQIP